MTAILNRDDVTRLEKEERRVKIAKKKAVALVDVGATAPGCVAVIDAAALATCLALSIYTVARGGSAARFGVRCCSMRKGAQCCVFFRCLGVARLDQHYLPGVTSGARGALHQRFIFALGPSSNPNVLTVLEYSLSVHGHSTCSAGISHY